MKNYRILAVGKIQLQAGQNTRTERLIARHREVIETVWKKALKTNGKRLFNGTLPSFIKFEQQGNKIRVVGNFIEYKHFLAQRNSKLKLGIKPIGVSGMIVLKEKKAEYVMFARRTNKVTEYPDFLELVPSGSIEKEYADNQGVIDYKSKLLSEFVEETGLQKRHVKEISDFAFVLDKTHQVYDVCCGLHLKATKAFVEREFSSDEYEEPVFVARNKLADFINAHRDSIVPTSMAIIEAYVKSTCP